MEAPYYEKYGRFWAVYDGLGLLVCVTVYRKGAREVIRRLLPLTLTTQAEGPNAFPPFPTGHAGPPSGIPERRIYHV